MRLPPVIWMPPPPRPELASWLFESLTSLSVRELLSSPPMIPPPPTVRALATAGDREPREVVLEADQEERVQAHDPVARVRGRARADLADDRLCLPAPVIVVL